MKSILVGEKVNLGAADIFLDRITKLIKSGAICLYT